MDTAIALIAALWLVLSLLNFTLATGTERIRNGLSLNGWQRLVSHAVRVPV